MSDENKYKNVGLTISGWKWYEVNKFTLPIIKSVVMYCKRVGIPYNSITFIGDTFYFDLKKVKHTDPIQALVDITHVIGLSLNAFQKKKFGPSMPLKEAWELKGFLYDPYDDTLKAKRKEMFLKLLKKEGSLKSINPSKLTRFKDYIFYAKKTRWGKDEKSLYPFYGLIFPRYTVTNHIEGKEPDNNGAVSLTSVKRSKNTMIVAQHPCKFATLCSSIFWDNGVFDPVHYSTEDLNGVHIEEFNVKGGA